MFNGDQNERVLFARGLSSIVIGLAYETYADGGALLACKLSPSQFSNAKKLNQSFIFTAVSRVQVSTTLLSLSLLNPNLIDYVP